MAEFPNEIFDCGWQCIQLRFHGFNSVWKRPWIEKLCLHCFDDISVIYEKIASEIFFFFVLSKIYRVLLIKFCGGFLLWKRIWDFKNNFFSKLNFLIIKNFGFICFDLKKMAQFSWATFEFFFYFCGQKKFKVFLTIFSRSH